MSITDKDRILRAIRDTLNGDPEAYTVIVTAYMDKLHRTALCLCTHPDAAEDLVQETLIDGYLHLSELRDHQKIGAWLTQILKYKALRQVVKARKTELYEELPDTPDHDTPDAYYRDSETMREWRKRLEALSPALRETAILYFWEDYTMEEIARRTNTPLGTVKGRIHTAREKLRKEYSMTETNMNTLPDSFAEALEKKVQELANYRKLYGSNAGFDSAYKSIKELIANLSDKADVEKYSLRSAEIAARNDPAAYSAEAFSTYKKYGKANDAACLYVNLAWKLGSEQEKADYLENTAIPALLEYPEDNDRHGGLGYLTFWQASHLLRTDAPDYDRVEALYGEAMEHYRHISSVNAMYGNTVAALKALPHLRESRPMTYFSITGESWWITEGNLYYWSEPGFSGGSELYRFHNPLFYFSGCVGDRYFFPRTADLTEGAEEIMTADDGHSCGIRRVVSTTETVTTPAGVFENCVHIDKEDTDGTVYSAWYKEGVGLVQSTVSSSPLKAKVLVSCEIKGGEGLLPLCVGNTWRYENPEKPDVMVEVTEYTIEQMGKGNGDKDMVSLSCLDYIALEPDWEMRTSDATLLFSKASDLCDAKRFSEAADTLRAIVIANSDRESVDCALSVLSYLEEKAQYDQAHWRFCPSSANISTLTLRQSHGCMTYDECDVFSCDTGVWGSRGEENRIFGVKPFRYLQSLTDTLWNDRWVAGYTEEHPHSWKNATIKLSVTDGGRVETPAGVFESTVCLTVEAGDTDAPRDTDYFFRNTEMGTKRFWFAPGVGVVRFTCDWGRHISSDCVLTAYRAVAAEGEMMPIHIGNTWQYDEVNLTAEGYIARRDYRVLSGMGDRYLLGDHQMFTFKGTVEEYEAYKAKLAAERAQ